MTKSLHDEFSQSDNLPPSDIIRRCKLLLYTLPSGRHLVDLLNLHRIPVSLETGIPAGYKVLHHSSIALTCPPPPDIPLYEMAIHLGCGIRAVELHIPTYLSPETKDSRHWMHPHLQEPFEVMLTICKLAYDMNYFSKNPEVEKFLAENHYAEIYQAYEQKTPYSQIEELMLKNFNAKN